jgi:hypothetical protein
MDRDAQDTRDIAIETRADLRSIKQSLSDYILESREHRDKQDARHKCLEKRIEEFQSLVDQAHGASWGAKGVLGLVAIIAGWAGSHIPGLSWLGDVPKH